MSPDRSVAPMPKNTSTDLETAYSAGLLDGEGCIALVWNKKERQSRLSVQVVNTDHRVLEWLQSRWGGAIYEMRGNSRHKDWARCWAWVVNGDSDRKKFLASILPHLIIKRREAEIALEFMAVGAAKRGRRLPPAVAGRRQALFLEIRGLRNPDIEPIVINDDQISMDLVG